MRDAEIKAEVERQMREAGVDGEVTVQNGEIRVEVRKKEQGNRTAKSPVSVDEDAV